MHYEIYPKKTDRADHINSVTEPTQFPCVELVHNSDWNDDFSYYDWFYMWFIPEKGKIIYLGDVKVMTTREQPTIEAMGTAHDGTFDNTFCSLGIGLDYYKRFKEVFTDDAVDCILKEMRDCAYDEHIYEQFHDNPEFKNALLRDQASLEALQKGRLLLKGLQSADDAYSFVYNYKEQYGAQNEIDFNVNFRFDGPAYVRTIGVIGENGIGKTQLLSHLTRDLLSNDVNGFNRVPLFNSCIAMHSTPFDDYPSPHDVINPRIPYFSISLEQHDQRTIDDLSAAISIIVNRPILFGKNLAGLYINNIEENIGEIVKGILEYKEAEDGIGYFEFHREILEEIIPILSSGQLQLFSMITHIFSQVHLSSLFIIDEPEVHLHPHTMVSFMRTLAGVLRTFRSYAIIATHSPLIIREVMQSNVQVMERVDDSITKLSVVPYSTFGEDITMLYYKIFGYDENYSYFTTIVTNKLKEYGSYQAVIAELRRDMALSLNAQMTIRNIAKELNIEDA